MTEPRQASPKIGDRWRANDPKANGRTVLVEDTDSRFATVRNVDTGRQSRIELWTFTRQGTTGWTRVTEE